MDEPVHDRAAVEAWTTPAGVRFEVGEPTVTSTHLVLSGRLINESEREVEIITDSPAGASFRILQFSGEGVRALPTEPVPPAAVAPLRFSLAPHSERVFTDRVALVDYEITPGGQGEILWSFSLANAPQQGRVPVELP